MDNIFALNNQVFGSSFRERRVSSRTRRAMRSELIIPDSAVEMTYSDMYEVNGGSISTTSLAAIIDVGLLVVCGAINFGIKAAGFFCKGAAKNYIRKNSPTWIRVFFNIQLVTTFIQNIGGNMSTIVSMFSDIDPIVDRIGNLLSIGGLIATICDVSSDGKWDNVCF